MKKQVYKQVLLIIFINASDDLRISTSHETNGQAYLRKELTLRICLSKPLCVLVVYLPNKILEYSNFLLFLSED